MSRRVFCYKWRAIRARAAPYVRTLLYYNIIGASLSEPHSSEDNAEVVCLSVMDRHGPRFDVFSFDDSYL